MFFTAVQFLQTSEISHGEEAVFLLLIAGNVLYKNQILSSIRCLTQGKKTYSSPECKKCFSAKSNLYTVKEMRI
ncbi:unnamed protein product [Staurois parvus]|uniref:Uncharacterized protein n=1 Tax=Staurois parvus TaxID=386267 RepID=A0ABN9H7W6_9NEOB|nr:unnamed protein product [Staurois parvus]